MSNNIIFSHIFRGNSEYFYFSPQNHSFDDNGFRSFFEILFVFEMKRRILRFRWRIMVGYIPCRTLTLLIICSTWFFNQQRSIILRSSSFLFCSKGILWAISGYSTRSILIPFSIRWWHLKCLSLSLGFYFYFYFIFHLYVSVHKLE